jgi:four helix bundle protein
MTNEEMKERTMAFALRVLRLAENLPKNLSAQTVAKQIVRSGTSVAANYRAALRAKSHADFVNKVTIVLEEADETAFWLELLERGELMPSAKIGALKNEAEELTKIFSATRRTARNHQS